jgi:hypothetical protein
LFAVADGGEKPQSSLGAKQGGQALALAPLAFLNAGKRFGQSRFEPYPQNLDQHCLLDRFGLDRFMWPPVLVAAIAARKALDSWAFDGAGCRIRTNDLRFTKTFATMRETSMKSA